MLPEENLTTLEDAAEAVRGSARSGAPGPGLVLLHECSGLPNNVSGVWWFREYRAAHVLYCTHCTSWTAGASIVVSWSRCGIAVRLA